MKPLKPIFRGPLGTILPGILLIGLVLVAGGAFSRPPQTNNLMATPTTGVSTQVAVRSSSYEVAREFVGRVEARRESQLSFELGGLVIVVRVDEGQRVEQGDIIAKLDTEILESQRASIAAQLRAAEATLEELAAGPRRETIDASRAEVERWESQVRLAALTRDRKAELVAGNAGSQQALDDASYALQTFSAQLRAAKARWLELENGTRRERVESQRAVVDRLQADLKTIDINLAKSTLRAPYSGTVARRMVDEGTVLQTGAPVIELLETSNLDVRVGISQEIAESLQLGSTHEVTVGGRTIAATVRTIRPDRHRETRTVSALLSLDPRDHVVLVGDLATVRFHHRIDQSGFWLPQTSLTESYRGLWGCYVAVPDATDGGAASHRLQLRELEVIHQTSDSAYVRGSLADGEAVVMAGVQRLVQDQPVRLSGPFASDPTLAFAPKK